MCHVYVLSFSWYISVCVVMGMPEFEKYNLRYEENFRIVRIRKVVTWSYFFFK